MIWMPMSQCCGTGDDAAECGGELLVRYFAGQLRGLVALPAGIGDVATGLLAPFVAYVWYSGKSYARSAAVAWNVLGVAALINAVALGTLTEPLWESASSCHEYQLRPPSRERILVRTAAVDHRHRDIEQTQID
jgi:hypothetical protein